MGAFVQTVLESTANAATTTASRTVSLPVAVPAGDTLLLCAGGESSSTLSSVSDSRGNTWAVDGTINNGIAAHVGFAHCHVTTALQAGDTVTVTEGTARSSLNIAIHQFTSLDTSQAVDKAAGGTGTSTTPATAATATTTQANELLYACFTINDQAKTGLTVTAGTGFTRLTYITTTRGSADRGLVAEYQFVNATDAQTGTLTLNQSLPYAAMIGTYKALTTPPPSQQSSPAAILGHL